MEHVARRCLAVLLAVCGAAFLGMGISKESVNAPFLAVRFDGSWSVLVGVVLAILAVVSLWTPARWTMSATTFAWAAFLALAVTQRPPQRGDVEWTGRASDLLPVATSGSLTDKRGPMVERAKPGTASTREGVGKAARTWKSKYDWMESNQAADGVYGWRGIANIVAHEKHRDFEVDYTHDSEGWRVMPSPAVNPPHGTIAFVGCSLTYGVGVADGETYSAVLAKEAWPSCRVLNRSFSGWGTGQALIGVQHLVRNSPKPDLIVYGFITNHLKRNYLRKAWFQKIGHWKFPYISLDRDGKLAFEGLRPTEEATAPDNEETARKEDAVTVAMVREMNRLCQEAGVGLIVVVLEQLEDRVVKELTSDPSLTVIDLHRACYDFHPIDFHPRPTWHRWIAHFLAADPRVANAARLPGLFRPDAVSVEGLSQSTPRFVLAKADANARFVATPGSTPAWRVEGIELNGGKSFDLQLVYEPFVLRKGVKHTFRFEAKSDRERTFTVVAADRMVRNRPMGLYREMNAGPQWQAVEAEFVPMHDCNDAIMAIQLGNSDVAVEFRNLEVLEEGRRIGPAVAPPPVAKARE